MSVYAWTPTEHNGVDLTATPFESVRFSASAGPGQSPGIEPVEASLIGVGDRFVDTQPHGAEWVLQVWLDATEQSDYDTLRTTFSEEDGLVYLKADDGDGTTYRVAVVVKYIERIGAAEFHVHLRVPDPIMEEDSETTTGPGTAFEAMAGASDQVAISNGGNRITRPKFRYSIITHKEMDPAKGWLEAYPGILATRSPLPWDRQPVAITDNNHTFTASIDTAAIVRQSATNGTLNGAINDSVTTINLNAGHGFSDGGQYFIIDAEGGNVEEQIYGELSGNVISNVVRGIGGTTADAHSDSAQINKSELLADCSDLRVFVNGQEVERWLGGPRTANTRVWITPSAPPAQKFTLSEDVGSGDTEITVEEDLSGMRRFGWLECDREALYYGDIDYETRTFKECVRGIWSTSASGHTVALGADIQRLDFLYVIATGRWGIGAAPEPIERRPAIHLKTSTNRDYYWDSDADDTDACYFDRDHPNRPMQWVPDYETAEEDYYEGTPPLLESADDMLGWKAGDPAQGKESVNKLRLYFPHGTATDSNTIEFDVQPRRELRMRLDGRNIHGQELALADYWDAQEGKLTAEDVEATECLYELSLSAPKACVLGNFETGTQINLDVSNTEACNKFILDRETSFEAVMFRLKKDNAGDTFGIKVRIRADDGDPNPDDGTVIIDFDTSDIATPWGDNLTTSYVVYSFWMDDGASGKQKLSLPAGTYWATVEVETLGGGEALRVDGGQARNKHTPLFSSNGDAYLHTPMWFGLIHPKDGPVQPEVDDRLNGGSEGYFQNVKVEGYAPSTHDRQIPLSDRGNNPDTSWSYVEGRLTNETNGDGFNLNLWLQHGATHYVEVDCEERTVTVQEGSGGRSYKLPVAIVPDDITEWLRMDPGSNTIKWAEAGMTDSDLTVYHRGRAA